ncbi:hypothetical protein Pse7367_0384 [Thalassoporum mexicanum PCC 7367]|uniref:mucoidy inhibitor MuiA family protein n=1 Tax=Thalassoporum mexicanum TaxID=3457544 RepID=UPI00029F919E|nr:mucoidy inhibitor MuiA family protein [Pseudanabaena sp. PCC 7367]AFY68695.1 hypothetical protein Pse7367_0384 [Pseudanabaena sp. PCC 7367]
MTNPDQANHPTQTNASPTEQRVVTAIAAVTVYSDRALVKRQGQTNLHEGNQTLLVSELPITLQVDSVRATGKGNIPVRLVEVRTERSFSQEPIAAKVAELTAQIEELEDQKLALQNDLNALIVQRDFVKGLGEKSIQRFCISLARDETSLEATQELLNFVGQNYGDYASAIATKHKAKKEVESKLSALIQQLKQLRSDRPQESYSLFVVVEAQATGEFTLEVSYVVQQTFWRPLYDIRVSEQGIILLSYLAEIVQTSGEDWLDPQLTLSTAKPGMGMLPPKLKPWYIDLNQPPVPTAIRTRQANAPNTPMMAKMSAPLAASAAAESFEFELDQVSTAEIKREGSTVSFAIGGGGDIPSDGNPHKITIFEREYQGEMKYVAIPQLSSFAYLQAIVKNPENGVTLLPGKANIFRGNMFVGTTKLANIAPGQEFKLNLGIDEGIQIERDLVEREVDKRFISGQRRTTYAYRLIVTNLSDRPAKLRLTEQLPTSRNEQIKVSLSRSNPTIQPKDLGILTWDLLLAANAKQEIYYQFTISHPPDITPVGLNI